MPNSRTAVARNMPTSPSSAFLASAVIVSLRSVGLFPALVVVPPGLGAVAAGLHRAPAPLAGAAVVEEQKKTFRIGAAPDLAELGACEKIARRPQDGRQQRQRRARLHVDVPVVAVTAALQGRARGRRGEGGVQGLEVAR